MAGWFCWIADVSLYKCQTFQLLFRGSVIKVLCYFKIQQMHIIISLQNPLIHYFHIDHKCTLFNLPPKFCINILFNIQYFSWDDCNLQEKLKTKCKIFGVNKVYKLWSMWCGEYSNLNGLSIGVIKKRVCAIRKLKWTNP